MSEQKKADGCRPNALLHTWTSWLMLALVLGGGIVALQNTEPVETRILFFTFSIPGAMLLIGTMIIGFLVGMYAKSLFRRTFRNSGNELNP